MTVQRVRNVFYSLSEFYFFKACYNLSFEDNKSRDALLNSFIEARNTYKRLQQGTSKQDEFVVKLDMVAESKKKLWECVTDDLPESEELDDGGIWLG